jgi:hypothetical protein
MNPDPPLPPIDADPGMVDRPDAGPIGADPAELGLREARRQALIEWTASSLAWGVLGTFAATVLSLSIYGMAGNRDDALELLKTVLPAVGTPLGIALGYYFTRQRRE